jgi:hypothetical protein
MESLAPIYVWSLWQDLRRGPDRNLAPPEKHFIDNLQMHCVWRIMDDRVYRSGTEYRTVEKHRWEASPYANVHTYSHDIYPAKAALGANGCTDCHHPNSQFLFAPVLTRLFDEAGMPVVEPQHLIRGLRRSEAMLGAWREVYLTPSLYGLTVVFCLALVTLLGDHAVQWVFKERPVPFVVRLFPPAVAVLAGIGALMLLGDSDLMEYMLPSRFWLDANHFPFAVGLMAIGAAALLWELRQWISNDEKGHTLVGTATALTLIVALGMTGLSGALVFLKIPGLQTITRFSYTLFDAALFVVLLATTVSILHGHIRNRGAEL